MENPWEYSFGVYYYQGKIINSNSRPIRVQSAPRRALDALWTRYGWNYRVRSRSTWSRWITLFSGWFREGWKNFGAHLELIAKQIWILAQIILQVRIKVQIILQYRSFQLVQSKIALKSSLAPCVRWWGHDLAPGVLCWNTRWLHHLLGFLGWVLDDWCI